MVCWCIERSLPWDFPRKSIRRSHRKISLVFGCLFFVVGCCWMNPFRRITTVHCWAAEQFYKQLEKFFFSQKWKHRKRQQKHLQHSTIIKSMQIFRSLSFPRFPCATMCAQRQRHSDHHSVWETLKMHTYKFVQNCWRVFFPEFGPIQTNRTKQMRQFVVKNGIAWLEVGACERGQEGLHFATNTKILDIYIFGTQNNGSFHGNGH